MSKARLIHLRYLGRDSYLKLKIYALEDIMYEDVEKHKEVGISLYDRKLFRLIRMGNFGHNSGRNER